MLAKFIAMIALFFTGIAIGILVMIYGWGLEPKSWWWIIGGGIGLRGVVFAVEAMVNKEK